MPRLSGLNSGDLLRPNRMGFTSSCDRARRMLPCLHDSTVALLHISSRAIALLCFQARYLLFEGAPRYDVLGKDRFHFRFAHACLGILEKIVAIFPSGL